MKLRISACLFALASCGAFAQSTDTSTLDQALTQQDGLTQVSDGFYTKTIGGTQSFVATSSAGQSALLAKLIDYRASAPAGSDASHAFDELIATLSAPHPKNQTTQGSCSGPAMTGPLYAQALAGGGLGGSPYGASSQAANTTSPLINTTNKAYAEVYDRNGNLVASQSTTTFGATMAYASAYQTAKGCTSDSGASLTCPGHTTPSIVATAINQRMYPQLCIPN